MPFYHQKKKKIDFHFLSIHQHSPLTMQQTQTSDKKNQTNKKKKPIWCCEKKLGPIVHFNSLLNIEEPVVEQASLPTDS